MDREQVEYEGADDHQRMRRARRLRLVVTSAELVQQKRGLFRRGRLEDDLPVPVLVADDQVRLGLESSAATVQMAEQAAMNVRQPRNGHPLVKSSRRIISSIASRYPASSRSLRL